MFGRLRPPPSSPDSLQRYPAKIIKDDPLSVYESTLLKLKQGSRLEDTVGPSESENPSSSLDIQREAHDGATLCNGSDDAMAIDSGSCVKKKNLPSVLSMFCRYNKDRAQARNLSLTVDTATTETESAL